MSVGRVYAVKKPPQGSDFVAPYTEIRPVPAVTIAASCLLRVCYSRTNQRTNDEREGEREREREREKKRKNMSASGVR